MEICTNILLNRWINNHKMIILSVHSLQTLAFSMEKCSFKRKRLKWKIIKVIYFRLGSSLYAELENASYIISWSFIYWLKVHIVRNTWKCVFIHFSSHNLKSAWVILVYPGWIYIWAMELRTQTIFSVIWHLESLWISNYFRRWILRSCLSSKSLE
jgi:hypothetical protein